jgi:hypothetical protein
MTNLLENLRHGLKSVRKTPAVTLTVLLTLAVGIGANSAIFTVDYATFLALLPYPVRQSRPRPGLSPPAGGPPVREAVVAMDFRTAAQVAVRWTTEARANRIKAVSHRESRFGPQQLHLDLSRLETIQSVVA